MVAQTIRTIKRDDTHVSSIEFSGTSHSVYLNKCNILATDP